MSKRTAEQALRDELEAARAALEAANARSERARRRVRTATEYREATDLEHTEAMARVERAERALAILVPLPITEEAGTDGNP